MPTRAGFTILELLLALLLVSIVAALAIPVYFKNDGVTLENAAVLLARDLRAAQNRSAYLGTPARFEFLEDGDGYRVLDGDGRVVRNPRNGDPFERRYSYDGVFEGVEVEKADFEGRRRQLFDARGRALAGGRIVLSFHGSQRELEIQRGSGRIRIVGSTSGWRDLGY